MENATTLNETEIKFKLTDYSLFIVTLASSALIGIYFGVKGRKKQSSANDYFLGNKSMHSFPIALSLISCNISGITMIAIPTDVYRFGAHFWMAAVATQMCIFVGYFITIPIFFNLGVSSTFEYLEMRFSAKLRRFASALYTFNMFSYLPIVVYVPALVLSQVTGFSIHIITVSVCAVCIFYTTIGGIKAVVWTDALQSIVMIGSVIAIVVIGTDNSGGVKQVIEECKKGDLFEIDYRMDPTIRDTVWSLAASMFYWLNFIAVGQSSVQKCLALPTFKEIKKAFYIVGIGLGVILYGSVYIGLLIYDKYNKCDPLLTKKIQVADQILPYYVLDVINKVPGLGGLFIASIFSGGISTLSAAMNALSCTIYNDFIAVYMPIDYPQEKVGNILKLTVVLVGVICTVLVFIIEQLGSILPLAISLPSISAGPLVGLFLMGMLVPTINSKGALYGCISSVVLLILMVLGSFYYKMQKLITFETKPTSTESCSTPFNVTTPIHPETDWKPFYLFRISFYYYSLIGVCTVFFVGWIVSYFSKADQKQVQKKLISPLMHWAMSDDLLPPTYNDVKENLELMEEITEKQ
ncbi:PREDICTED: sodium-coupled monocarboxylate transporter 2-like [Nicrophorus vespilloides]|uniref:Sodium-coupled monocarboxylate transporter 2-like n=1 Tax=Nicrophorus vespilloides TaxID=110193 RepID=A0ABM1M5W5_NICVS|nr:PREDICTED: sodium-coupled monocarboxylate transporter 2-like [Nicrophorus vespilloides]